MSPNNCDRCGHDMNMCECPKGLQVGGDHYVAEYQHWDWSMDVRLGVFEYCATKYISRWYKKNGIQDLKKAKSYLLKAHEGFLEGRWYNQNLHVDTWPMARDKAEMMFNTFVESANIYPVEAELCLDIAKWKTEEDLRMLDYHVGTLIEAAQHQHLKHGTLAPLTYAGLRHAAKTGGSGRVGGTTTQAQPSAASTEQSEPFGYQGDG